MCKTFFVALVFVVTLGGMAGADDQSDARAILDEGIKARGGEATLGKFVGIYIKAKGSSWEKPLSVEWFINGSDKMREVFLDKNDRVDWLYVVDGKEGWEKDRDQEAKKIDEDMLPYRVDEIREICATMLPPSNVKLSRVSRLDKTSVTGRMAVGVFHDDRVELHFDRESHLLVKYIRHIKNFEGEEISTEERMYSDYRNVQGTKQPFKIETFDDGVKRTELVVSEVKLYEKPLDEKLFSKP